MTLISPHCPPRSSCICLAKMGSGASGLALYWNRLVWENTFVLLSERPSTWRRQTLLASTTPPLFPSQRLANGRYRKGASRAGRFYSPECVEGEFCEVRSSPRYSHRRFPPVRKTARHPI